MFYKAVVQLVLLYGSKTWNLKKATLVRLEGFHRMAVVHKPRREVNLVWVYLRFQDVLNECGTRTIAHHIGIRWETIMEYAVNCPI